MTRRSMGGKYHDACIAQPLEEIGKDLRGREHSHSADSDNTLKALQMT